MVENSRIKIVVMRKSNSDYCVVLFHVAGVA